MPKLWGGRFTGDVDPQMVAFNCSLGFDSRMATQDLVASQAYAKALHRNSLLTASELELMLNGLNQVLEEWGSGTFKTQESDEDIHSANERRLHEIVGKIAGKLHTGRSRNDQVATDLRMWLREQAASIRLMLLALIRVTVDRAEREIDVLIPGYTHLQRAQPIRWSHFLLAHVWSWQQDYERLEQLTKRINQLPLGCGALAGNPFNIDREFLRSELMFETIMPNSIYSVSDRDFVAEFLSWSTLLMIHLSRFSEDLIIYSTTEFGFIKLADAYSTGSSLMPQKKNPDSLELIRGKSGRVFGKMSGFLMTYKGTPSAYNKDLQEDKEPLFDAVDTVSGCIQITEGVVATLAIDSEKMRMALSIDMLATDLAEYLVRKGVPFRETHHISGQAVRMAEERKCPMNELSLEQLRSLHPCFEADVSLVWDFEKSVENRCSLGGTSKGSVAHQISLLKSIFNEVKQ